MKIVIIILVVLLIAAAVGFVVFRKMQLQNEQDALDVPSPKGRFKGATNSHDEELHEPTPTNANPLAIAETHLSNQNYPEAISSLKNVLMTNPRHQGAMLKLLQVYGLTKQYEAFNQLHQKIHEIGDGETIREADFCKSLLDEETKAEQQAQALHSTTNNTPVSSVDTLDFNIEPEISSQPVRSSTPTPSNTQEELLDLDFDVPSNKVATANDSELSEFDDFNFDEPKAENKSAPAQDDISLDADFNFDPTPAPAVEPKAQADDLSFGLDADFGFDEPKVESKPDPAPQADDSFDFDLTPEPVKAPQVDDGLNLDAGFDFDPEPAKPAVDNALDLDADFNFDPTPAPAVEPKAQADDLSFGLDEPKVEVSPTQDDGLNLDEIPEVTVAHQTFDDEPVAFGADNNQEIPSEIGFVSTLDNAQITLDLAKQYLEFGEYESAKHLLQEVAKTGNDEQRQEAINTIKRMG